MDPYKNIYDDDEEVTITCVLNRFVSWGTTENEGSGQLVCKAGVWKRADDLEYSGIMGCVGELLR